MSRVVGGLGRGGWGKVGWERAEGHWRTRDEFYQYICTYYMYSVRSGCYTMSRHLNNVFTLMHGSISSTDLDLGIAICEVLALR